MNLSQAQWGGIIRALMVFVATVTGVLGYLKGVPWETITSLIIGMIPVVWSVKSNSVPTMIEHVQASPTVTKVEMKTDALANATPTLAASPKVVGPNG